MIRQAWDLCKVYESRAGSWGLRLLPIGFDVGFAVHSVSLCSTVPDHLDALASHTTSLLYQLADAAAAVQDTTSAAGDAAKSNNGGFFGPLASLFETILKV